MQALRTQLRKYHTPRSLFDGGYRGVWYDLSDSSTMFSDAGGALITDGGTVYTLHDKSGNQNTIIQATSGARPTWNKLGYLAFDSAATADYMQRADGIGFADGARLPDAFTILALLAGTPATGTYFCSLGSSASGNPAISFGSQSTTSTTLTGFLRSDSGSGGMANSFGIRAGAFSATPTVCGVTIQGLVSANRLITTINGDRTFVSGADLTGTYTLDRFTLGALGRTTVASHMAINMYQILLINRVLSQSEIMTTIDDWKKRATL